MIASERRFVGLRWGAILTAALLALLCLLWVYPFLWLLSASLKEPLEIFSKGLNLIPDKAQWRTMRAPGPRRGLRITCSTPSW